MDAMRAPIVLSLGRMKNPKYRYTLIKYTSGEWFSSFNRISIKSYLEPIDHGIHLLLIDLVCVDMKTVFLRAGHSSELELNQMKNFNVMWCVVGR